MTKEFFWSGSSGDKFTVTYSGTPTDGSEVSIVSDINISSSTRTKTIYACTTNDPTIRVQLDVVQNAAYQLRTIQIDKSVPMSCSFRGMTITGAGIAVDLNIPVDSISGTVLHVSTLKLVYNSGHFYIEADTVSQAGTYYIVDAGSAGYYMSKTSTFYPYPTFEWSNGDTIYVTRTSMKGLYSFSTSDASLTLIGQPSTSEIYFNTSNGKAYRYDGTTLVEITD